MYAFALFAHVVSVMLLLGLVVGGDAVLAEARRGNTSLLPFFVRRFQPLERFAVVASLLTGGALLLVNPAGTMLLTVGTWIRAKTAMALLAGVLVWRSHPGIRPEGATRSARILRDLAQLLLVGCVFAATAWRMF